jgi:hypothetical protein
VIACPYAAAICGKLMHESAISVLPWSALQPPSERITPPPA